MNFSTTLFRCSALGHLMVDPRTKAAKEAGELSETTKTHLIDIYVSAKYGRQTDISNKYITKGLMVEEDSITLYSRVKKTFFKKNEKNLSNEFIKGTPDLFTGLEIEAAESIIDIKSSWDIFTYFRNHSKGVSDLYYWQLQGYMALTGAKNAKLAFCLIDTPETLILDAKRKLMWQMNAGTEENEDYVKACEEIDLKMIYTDIPMKDKVMEFDIERNDEGIERLYSKVRKAREFLNEIEASLNPDVMLATYNHSLRATIIE
jgi:hypothetical protein